MANFTDGVKNFVNDLVNRRNPQNQNVVMSDGKLSDAVKREAFKSGIHNKAIRLKSGHALKNTINFDSTADREYFNHRLAPHVKKATAGMLGFGRGVVVVHVPGEDDVSKPLSRNIDHNRLKFDSFYGDIVTVSNIEMDLSSPNYFKPLEYTIRGQSFHHSRVIDFTYIEPSEYEASEYRYGGISETELVYKQLINDGIVERASATIVEKASTFVYKLTGFKDALRNKNEKSLLRYFERMEDVRNIFGAVIIDGEDDASAVQQNISNLSEASDMSLRRLALVYGIPISELTGEQVGGLNNSGEKERVTFQNTIESLQSDYLLAPLNKLCMICGLGPISFKENQGETPTGSAQYDKIILENAALLWQMGEDHSKYLEQKGVIEPDDWDDFFSNESEEAEQPDAEQQRMLAEMISGETSNI